MDRKRHSDLGGRRPAADTYAILEEFRESGARPSPEELRAAAVEYAHSTCRLEGNALSPEQAASIIGDGTVSGQKIRIRDILELIGAHRALLRMLEAVSSGEALSTELLKELNWLAVGLLFYEGYYHPYREAGQQVGDYKVRNNRIAITFADGTRHTIQPLSTPESVATNMSMLLRQVEMSGKTSVEKAAFLAREIWLHQPFIDGNKRTARLLVNFLTMREGFPLFTYSGEGQLFNHLLVTQYTESRVGLLEGFIAGALADRMQELLGKEA